MDNLLVGKKVKYKNGGLVVYTCLAVAVVDNVIKLVVVDSDGCLYENKLQDFVVEYED
jgi:hypothetical protein